MKLQSIIVLFFSTIILFSCTSTQQETSPEKAVTKQSYIDHTPTAHHKVALEVLKASKDWIIAFNKGDADYCVAGYQKDAIMRATPFGISKNATEIGNFWKPFIASGATNLIYTNVSVEVVNATTVLLSANWSMNVGEGVIYQEKWVKDASEWKLAYDDFQVLHKYETPKENTANPIASHLILEEVIKTSMDWTNGFNQKKGAICGQGYTTDAIMNAVPFANLNDQKSITSFWTKLIADGATNLTYHNPTFEVITATTVKLNANWSMNIGEGKIYQEKWINKDGKWLLDYDEFEVLKKY